MPHMSHHVTVCFELKPTSTFQLHVFLFFFLFFFPARNCWLCQSKHTPQLTTKSPSMILWNGNHFNKITQNYPQRNKSRRENVAYIDQNLKPKKNQNRQNKKGPTNRFCVHKRTTSPSICHVWFDKNFNDNLFLCWELRIYIYIYIYIFI